MSKRTPAQIEASRRNGALSRGPRTSEGRSRSAQNALKHGLTANTVLLDGESHPRFQQLLEEIVAELDPQGTLEFMAVEEIVVALWKQRRSWAIEAASFSVAARKAAGHAEAGDSLSRITGAWRQLHKHGQDFHNLLLQQSRLNQQLDRAYRRFQQFAALRRHQPEPNELFEFEHQNPAESAPQPAQPADSTQEQSEHAI